jgi:hypothetical protein
MPMSGLTNHLFRRWLRIDRPGRCFVGDVWHVSSLRAAHSQMLQITAELDVEGGHGAVSASGLEPGHVDRSAAAANTFSGLGRASPTGLVASAITKKKTPPSVVSSVVPMNLGECMNEGEAVIQRHSKHRCKRYLCTTQKPCLFDHSSATV